MAFYSYLVAAHITAVVFLIGGMFAHNRIMNAIIQYPLDRQTAALEPLRRLERSVTAPALLLTWTFGLGLALWGGWFPDMWLVVKLIVVIGLSGLHGVQSGQLRRMLRDERPASTIPWSGTSILIGMLTIAILAVVKPF
ncbi:CopD family protein [Stappia sp.]|uniref:CopD family protein n=1 Tax=Stappia sp. TaxID=1870903 RepID=UPI003D1360FE